MTNITDNNTFWNSVEQGISKTPADNQRNSLYDIANASYCLKQSLSLVDTFLDRGKDPQKYMDYSKFRGYLFSLSYLDNSKRITNLIELGLAIAQMEECFAKTKKEEYRSKIKKVYSLMIQETEDLLKEELKEVKEYIYGIKSENRKSYLKNIMNSSSKRDLASFILEYL